ncbi:MAG: hypothetical protein NVS9B10_06860 [Nevskia sp.]
MNMKRAGRISAWWAGAGFALAFGLAVHAAAPPSDQELQKFVAASVEVQRINAASEAEQQKARSPEAASKIEDEAATKMEQAVVAKGLTTDRFKALYEVMQSDPKVRARVTELARQQTGGK